MKKYFLFLESKIEVSEVIKPNRKESKYKVLSIMDNPFMPCFEVIYEDMLNNQYEYTLGRFVNGIWETYLYFTSSKKLIIEED